MMSHHKNRIRGFSVIELLVVCAIMALLFGIVLFQTQKAKSLSRDGQRAADISRIQAALGLYFADHQNYPATISGSVLVPTYMAALPTDPGTGSDYVYAGVDLNSSGASCESYHLGAVLENSGFTGLTQDSDGTAGTACTGSAADFDGNATNCSGGTASLPDMCFDLAP